MKTTLAEGGINVTRDRVMWQLRLTRRDARHLVHELHRIIGREPKEKKWRFGQGSLLIICTPHDPWPTISISGSPLFTPTVPDWMHFTERLEDYAHGRKR